MCRLWKILPALLPPARIVDSKLEALQKNIVEATAAIDAGERELASFAEAAQGKLLTRANDEGPVA